MHENMKKSQGNKGEGRGLSGILKEYIGQKGVFLCSRFTYLGFVSEVGDTGEPYVVIADAVAVEQSGKCESDAPEHCDPVHGDVILALGAVEIFFQPRWSQVYKLPGEEAKEKSKK